MSTPLRLGRIDFINVLPVHRHLDPRQGWFEEVAAVPSRLNRLLRAGELDVSAVSSVEYALAADQYLILAGLGLCSRGPVGSVLLLSQEPASAWTGRAIEAPFESDTSVALMRLLLRRWGLDCRLVEEGADPQPAAWLRIGNRALKEKASGRWAQVWDLGQVWQEWTGLPFVYALWVVRGEAARQRAGEVARLHQALLAARDQGLADLEGCAQEAAASLGGPAAQYLAYFQGLGFGLGPEEAQGLAKFYALLAEAGLLAVPPALRWFTPPASQAAPQPPTTDATA